MTTDNTQELDEILREYSGRILTYDELYRKQHHSNHRRAVDFEYADSVVKQAILDWHNKQVEVVLYRLRAEAGFYQYTDNEVVPLSAIEAERTKLKENSDE